jgi:hypothetical protein
MGTNRTFNDLGPLQRKFMLRAFNEGVALDDPLATEKRTGTLKTAGLIEKRQSKKGRMSWRCTDTGRGLVMAHTPVFLHRRGFPSYTTRQHEAMFGEPECVTDYAA